MLYIIGTPIGNLNDLSYRAVKTLTESDIILAEDTRSAYILLSKISQLYSIPSIPSIPPIPLYSSNPSKPRIISYYREKEFEKLPEIINWLKQGKNISLISESGMPLISDPGYLLVRTCVKKNISYIVVPGPSAITTALSASGFNPSAKDSGFMFLGFFPKKSSEINSLINRLIEVKKTFSEMIFVFYESPLRIKETLRCIDLSAKSADTSYFNPDIVICRELTKIHEEIIRGKAKDLINRDYKGEIVFLLS